MKTPDGNALINHYNSLLQSREVTVSLEAMTESTSVSKPEFDDKSLIDRVDKTRESLDYVVTNYLGNTRELHDLANQIADKGLEALNYVINEEGDRLTEDDDLLSGLEAVVRLDGSRPSFMIRDGAVDTLTSPLGNWEGDLVASADVLTDTIACVGRIDLPGSDSNFAGTGFLVQENLILTNRHVLQLAAKWDGSDWQFPEGVFIDFGHEYQGRASIDRRALKKVIFVGAEPIDLRAATADHSKLDLALIEISPSQGQSSGKFLQIEKSPDWAASSFSPVYVLGYPGPPALGTVSFTLLEQLFQATFGFKRLAPGYPMLTGQVLPPTSMAHDATTLGGNSGSPVVVVGREYSVAALHYGGRSRDPRENWGHNFGQVLEKTGGLSTDTLYEVLEKHGARFTQRTLSRPQ